MKHSLWIIVPALAVAGCQKKPAAENSGTEVATAEDAGISLPRILPPPTDARSYLDKAAAGDSFEIQSSQAVLKTTSNEAIRDFAKMMVSAHQKSSRTLRDAAGSLHLAPGSAALSSDQQQKLDAIKGAQGADADSLYLEAQRSAHGDALDLHKHYASDGDTPSLKQAAATIAPVVQQHLDALDKLLKPAAGN